MRWVVSYAHKPGSDGDYVSITTGVVRPQCIVRGKRASPTMTAAVSTILEELLVMLGMGCSGQRRRGREVKVEWSLVCSGKTEQLS